MPHDLDWDVLLRRINRQQCTPFLGAGAAFGALPLGAELSREWARQFDYPLEDCTDLARVAQYLAVTHDAVMPKELIAECFRGVTPPDFHQPDEPHGVLADLPLPIYLTTNYDPFMTLALRDRHRDPRQELCRWNGAIAHKVSVFDSDLGYQPTPANPVVYHLHGHLGCTESLVVSEDDYLDFLVSITRDTGLLPPRIQESMTGASILFLGYRIADWNFRVLFQSLVGYLERSVRRVHISVQLAPGSETESGEQKQKVFSYLNKYYENLKVQVYWGTCRQFAAELRQRWEDYRRAAP
ncbi:MAG TPA: SIR2 family protein [Thermoanaerobaculia bacterium]|nr:SIR2 family protein [Thermoanaerobaculia bacterium]